MKPKCTENHDTRTVRESMCAVVCPIDRRHTTRQRERAWVTSVYLVAYVPLKIRSSGRATTPDMSMLFLPQQSRACPAKHLAIRAVLLQNLVVFFVHQALSWHIDMLLPWSNVWYVVCINLPRSSASGSPFHVQRAQTFLTSDVMIRDTIAVDNAPCATHC